IGEASVAPGFYRVHLSCDGSHRIASVSITDGNHTSEVSKDGFQVKLARGDRLKIAVRVLPLEANDPGWVQLFNGKNLDGWKTHPELSGNWRVENNAIVGDRTFSYLFTDRDDFRDFHLRLEAKINRDGDSGVFFRTPFGRGIPALPGYEAQIMADPGQA